jgi:hypothetical protein
LELGLEPGLELGSRVEAWEGFEAVLRAAERLPAATSAVDCGWPMSGGVVGTMAIGRRTTSAVDCGAGRDAAL